MPALAPRQATRTTSSSSSQANTDGTRFIPSQTGSPGNGNQSSGTTFDIWKYIVVIVLACFALTVFIRLCLVQRLRRNRLLAFQAVEDRRHEERRLRRQRERELARVESRASSLGDSVFEPENEAVALPPAYDQTVPPPRPTTTLAPLAHPALARPTPFSRLSSLFKRQPSHPSASLSTPPVPLQPLPSSPPNPSAPQTAANPNHAPSHSTVAQVTELRRNLRAFAGTSAGRRATTGGPGEGPSPAVLASAATAFASTLPRSLDDDEDEARRRSARRARRRERRRREREREEAVGLPTYSKEAGEGEEVLQRAEGVKEDEESDGGGESEGESEGGDEGRARRESLASGSGSGTATRRTGPGVLESIENVGTMERSRDSPA